jgi:hypothetical protein
MCLDARRVAAAASAAGSARQQHFAPDVNGGNLVNTEEKGALDDWYVHNASFWLDLRIAFYTLMFLFTGERRFEQAVQQATLLQQTNGHSKVPEERKRAEIREINAARRPSLPTIPVSARARADQRRRATSFD